MAIEGPIDFAIALIGMGVQPVTHMTLEALAILQRCRWGFVAGPDQPTVDHLRSELASHLKPGESLPPLLSLSAAYRVDRQRLQNYAEAADIVLRATESERPIAYLTFGNPVTYDTVSQEILAAARARSLPVVVIAGISSVDTVLADLGQEAGPGLQIFDASCFVGAAVQPDTRFACLLMQIGVFGTNYPVIDRQPQGNALAALRDYLLRFYPGQHSATLVRSSTDPNQAAQIHRATVESLDQLPANALQGTSLYIPALDIPRLEERFQERMDSLENRNATYVKTSG